MGMDTDSGCVVFLKFEDFKWSATYWHAIAQRWKTVIAFLTEIDTEMVEDEVASP